MSNAKGLLDLLMGGLGQAPAGAQPGPGQGGQAAGAGFGGEALGGVAEQVKGAAAGMPGWAGPAALGGLAGLLLGSKGGRKMLGKGAMVGGLAVLGGLAYKAYRNWETEKAAGGGQPAHAPEPLDARDLPPADGRFLPPAADEGAAQAQALVLMRAMISAAKADGHIDADEQQRIFSQIRDLDLGAEDKSLLMDELGKPLDIREVAHMATSPEMAAEIYAASVIMVDEQSPVERAYLDELAGRLALPPGLAHQLEAQVGADYAY